jgi:PAS domain S-box-containing protein
MNSKKLKYNSSFLMGGGEMGALIRQKDWNNAPVGSPEQWPQSLRTTLSIILNSKFPMFLFWGPELICFYNDAYRPSLGNHGKHPDLLGGRAEDYWAETWTRIKPNIDQVLAGGEAIWREDQLYSMNINGKMEDFYWTFCFSAVHDESGEPAGVLVTCTETTKKIIALKSLAESEERLKFTINAAELATWDIDPLTNTLKVNERWREWFGFGKDEDIEVAQALTRMPEKDRQRIVEAMQAALTPGSSGSFEIEHSMFNALHNKERIIRAKGKTSFNEQHVAYRFSGTAQDITEYVNARKQLEDSLEQLNFALEGGNLGHFDSYPQTGQVNWSPRAKAFFGVLPDAEVNLQTYKQVIHPDDFERSKATMLNALKMESGGKYENDFRSVSPIDGRIRWLQIKGTVQYDAEGSAQRVSGVIQDITQNKESQQILKESEEHFHTLADNMAQLAWMAGATGRRYWYNQRWYDYTGTTLEEMQDEAWQKRHHPNHLDRVVKSLQNSWDTGEVWEDTFPLRGKDGQYRWFLSRAIPIKDEQGKVLRWFGTNTDITEQKESKELLRKTKEQLELTFANVPAAIFLYSHEKEILFANERAAHLLGYNTVEALLNEKHYDVLMQKAGENYDVKDEKDQPVSREKLPSELALKVGQHGELVFSMQKKSGGTKIWLLNKSAPIFGENGEVAMVLTTSTDITAQKTAEEKIRSSEERFRQLAEQAPMWVWMTDLEMNMLYANHEVLKHAGLSHFSQFIEHSWVNFTHPEDIVIIAEHFKKALAQQISFEFEARLKNAQTNQYEWFYMKAVPRLEGDIFIGFIGTAINIHQQKLHLEKLQESEEIFRQLSDLMPEKILRTDSDGNVIYYNKSWLDYTGLSYEALKNWGWAQTIHPDDIEELTRLWTHSVRTGNDFDIEFRIVHKTGQYRWHLARASAIKDAEGIIKNWVGVTIDIEQRKSFTLELEQQVAARTKELKTANDMLLDQNERLTASENFNRSLTDISPTMVYIHDIEKNKPVFLNNMYLNFVGYNWEKVVELDNKFISSVIHPDDLAFCNDLLQKVITSEVGVVFEGNFRRKNAYGVWVPFLNRLTAFKRNRKNEVTQIIGVAIDISALKKAEDFLKQKNQDLENMNKELQAFAYISSHDLQEPLRKIQTFANRIVEKEFNNLSDTGKNYFKRMEEAARRMRTLIDDLLAYSHTNRQDRKFEKVHLADVVEEVRLEFAEELNKKQAIFEATDLCECTVIPFQLRQLIHNLISNALKFAKHNQPLHLKIKSEIAKGKKFHHPKLEPEKEYCHIRISDNGIGFEPQYSEKIFEVFQRLHGKEQYSGTGIGLSIVKKIMDNHNGIITANGALNKGATFDIYMPYF